MKPETPKTIVLKDYRPAPYLIDSVSLVFSLDTERTVVRSKLAMRPNPASAVAGGPVEFDGEALSLVSLAVDGRSLAADRYTASLSGLAIHDPPQKPFTIELVNTCNPASNTALSGLYISNGMYCTQCEAEGFRRITYFYDRPDIMARYSVRIEADKGSCPVLLSNGNPSRSGEIGGTNLHFAEWDDPFPKPSYLFALVAGDLASIHDNFKTASGRTVALGIYVEKGKENRCDWAMQSLKGAMAWDERRFGREYDLDVFNIVAVSDFNMGAMENKGLNIFNDKYILALPGTATDSDYINIEAIIAHEYFHNWTGNRITCRDWFQLCLKEGLTVFRDQEFTSDVRSRAVKRIADVKTLRARQFPEDGGPLAHPVRPSSYIEINNFYTPTVYEKGAEICRMMLALVGETAFRKAMDLYFVRHDGEAATVEDFVRCMADASGRDFSQFFRWYEQAGTPRLTAEARHDAETKTLELTLEQHTPPTSGQAEKLPLHIPLGVGLVGPDGQDMPLDLEGVGVLNSGMIELREAKETFRFRNVSCRPVLSLNRGFTAPVQLASNSPPEDHLFLMAHDGDSFCRWEAGQTVARDILLSGIGGRLDGALAAAYGEALLSILRDKRADDAFKALMLGLPGEAEIAAIIGKDVDTDKVFAARETAKATIGRKLSAALGDIWASTSEGGDYAPSPAATARRSLRYAALGLVVSGEPNHGIQLARQELAEASSMTAEIGALTALLQTDCAARDEALLQFHDRHRADHLLLDKWFMLMAQCHARDTARRVEELTRHEAFTWATPNRVFALLGGFASGNMAGFNSADGEGYRVVADAILKADETNPQVAARLATSFRSFRLLEKTRRDAALAQINRVLAEPRLSRDVFEIASRIAIA